MSNILNNIIVDASKIRESALKTAETALKEKYAQEFRHLMLEEEADDKELLLDDEDGMGGDESLNPQDTPLGGAPLSEMEPDLSAGDPTDETGEMATDDTPIEEPEIMENIPFAFDSEDGDEETVTIDLGELEQEVDKEIASELGDKIMSRDEMTEEGEENITDPTELEDRKTPDDNMSDISDEDLFVSKESFDRFLESIEEKPDYSLVEEELERQLTQVTESFKDSYEKELLKYKKALQSEKQRVETLREKNEKLALLNYQLLYKNKALIDPSLNERQKESVCRALSKASTVNEVKAIFESVKYIATSKPTKNAGNKRDMIKENKLTSFIVRSKAQGKEVGSEKNRQITEAKERMQKLAGIIT